MTEKIVRPEDLQFEEQGGATTAASADGQQYGPRNLETSLKNTGLETAGLENVSRTAIDAFVTRIGNGLSLPLESHHFFAYFTSLNVKPIGTELYFQYEIPTVMAAADAAESLRVITGSTATATELLQTIMEYTPGKEIVDLHLVVFPEYPVVEEKVMEKNNGRQTNVGFKSLPAGWAELLSFPPRARTFLAGALYEKEVRTASEIQIRHTKKGFDLPLSTRELLEYAHANSIPNVSTYLKLLGGKS